MPDPAFLVEGHMEQLALKRLGCKVPIQRIEANGDSVEMSAMAVRVAALWKILGNKYYPVYVIFDRENRVETAEQLELELIRVLVDIHGCPEEQFVVCCCDRMIENWILADSELCESEFGGCEEVCEGVHGKKKLKNLLGRKGMYSETTVGVKLLTQANSATLVSRSPSFRRFAMRSHFRCSWLEPARMELCK
ncbi:hypothetical protein [Bauldia sp.]|uniref:hypothetical protein n=1 Tax=Bauldia sp. TaxID=2575872 RepID=UPI003BAAAB9B